MLSKHWNLNKEKKIPILSIKGYIQVTEDIYYIIIFLTLLKKFILFDQF